MSASQLLREYIKRHNTLVSYGQVENLMDLFHPNAKMIFEDIPFGPLNSKEEIAQAFQSSPPTDLLILNTIVGSSDPAISNECFADYEWQSKPNIRAGSVRLRSNGLYIIELTILR